MMKKILILIVLTMICYPYAGPMNAAEQDNTPIVVDDKSVKTFLDKIEIYGHIAKPQTVFIIPGTDPRVDGIQIERRFFNDIFRTVEKSTLRKEWIQEQRRKDHLLW